MNFVRQNMFLVILVGVVVVVGGGMLAVLSSMAGDVDEAKAQRLDTANELSSLAGKREKVNKAIIDAKRASAKFAYEIDMALYDQHIAHNARRYRVLELPLYDTVTGKLLLSLSDVDWPALMKALRGDAPLSADPKRMADKIWQAIPEDVRSALPPKGQPLNADQRRVMLGALNGILQQPDFYQSGQYPDVKKLQLPEAVDRIVRQRDKAALAKKEDPASREARFAPLLAQRLNRMVLTAFFPGIFTSCQIPAFPYNEQKYRQHALKFHFVRQYQQAMTALLDGLRPTRPPNAEEINAEVLLWNKQIIKIEQYNRRLQRKMEEEARGRSRPITPVGRGREPDGPMMDPEMDMGMYRGVYGGRDLGKYVRQGKTGSGKKEVKLDAEALGTMTARMRRAEEGLIYADAADLGLRWPLDQTTATSPTELELWQAQVSLWVTRDLIEAVRLTNEAGLAGVSPKEQNVLRAPIKKIEGIRVEAFGWSPDGKDGRAARSAVVDANMPMLAPPGGGRSRGRTAVPAVPAADSLTTRNSTKAYDIVKYTMTLIMAPEEVRKLQEYLLTLNYHVILGVTMEAVPEDEKSDAYYLGSQRGLLVTIRGELPLLTDWTRGKWDPRAKEWLAWNRAPRPSDPKVHYSNWVPGSPLMPVNVLYSGVIKIAALRPEDGVRIRKARGATGLTSPR